MRKFQRLLLVLKRSYISYYKICMTTFNLSANEVASFLLEHWAWENVNSDYHLQICFKLTSNKTKYSRVDQVKFMEDSL